jgi:hypothetical protein
VGIKNKKMEIIKLKLSKDQKKDLKILSKNLSKSIQKEHDPETIYYIGMAYLKRADLFLTDSALRELLQSFSKAV